MNAHVSPRLSGPELERLLFHWPRVVEVAPVGWSRDFALSIAGQSRRRGWKPTAKQGALMRRMVSDLFAYPDDHGGDPLIEKEDRAAFG